MSTGRILETPGELARLLDEVKTIAVVGLSPRPDRDSHSISLYLKDQGYRIIGIHPAESELLGEPAYPSLSALPEAERARVDLVAVFRRPEDAPAVLEEAARLGLRQVWLVPGSSSREALEVGAREDLTLVADMCLRTVHATVRRRRP